MRLGVIAAIVVSGLAAFVGAVTLAKVLGDDADTKPRSAAPAAAGAAGFARDIVSLLAQNRYEQAWRRLHPLHKEQTSFSEYVRCEKLSPIPGLLVSVTNGPAADVPTTLAPGRLVPSMAVPVRVVLRDVATGESTSVTTTVHAVSVGGRWTWILPQHRLADYSADRCSDAVYVPPS